MRSSDQPMSDQSHTPFPLATFLVVSAALFMVTLDNLVVTTALPSIRVDLGATIESLEWTVNAYTLAYAVLLLTGAALGDRFGRRRMFVIGVGIFKAPSIVAGNTSGTMEFLFAWLLGGAISLCGALVYAELSARHPETGGEYTFLRHGLGNGAAFLFAWARMTVIQTGAIAAVAFVFGEYASEVFRLGEQSAAIYAAICVVAITLLNFAGTLESKTLQKVMEVVLISGLLFLAVAGMVVGSTPKPAAAASGGGDFLFAMMFVFFTFGGWNEAAYLSGEVRDARRNMIRILIGGILAVTVIVKIAFLQRFFGALHGTIGFGQLFHVAGAKLFKLALQLFHVLAQRRLPVFETATAIGLAAGLGAFFCTLPARLGLTSLLVGILLLAGLRVLILALLLSFG